MFFKPQTLNLTLIPVQGGSGAGTQGPELRDQRSRENRVTSDAISMRFSR